MEPFQYWQGGHGLPHITPPGVEWPEGEAFAEALRVMAGEAPVVDFGCGRGRLAGSFPSETYRGVDICPQALAIARERHPEHSFELVDDQGSIVSDGMIFLHTVLLHVPDGEIGSLLSRLDAPRIIVSEIMGREWRRQGNPPVFNRDMADYARLFHEAGKRLTKTTFLPYERYGGVLLTMMEFQ